MSHEIRTPMNAVVGLAHILSNSSPLTQKQRECLATLQTSADTLLSLINDLLDIAKIEAATMELEAIPFDLGQLAQEVASMVEMRAQEKKLQWRTDIGAVRGRMFIGDPKRLQQVMLNLCSNAVKFTEVGGVSLAVRCEGDGQACRIAIAVTDTGIGISHDKKESIFQKFVQADSSIGRRYGGTGLGLAITRQLVELMGGEIDVESAPGEGSCFTVRLTMAEAAGVPLPVAVAEPPVETPVRSVRGKVLLVEDYAPNVLVATTFLDMFGYAYEVANNGVEALERVRGEAYHAVLMDVQMHEMDGLETTRRIRRMEQEEGRAPLHIIGMTAHALAGDRERCIEAGMDDYLTKPFDPDMLERKLAALGPEKKAA